MMMLMMMMMNKKNKSGISKSLVFILPVFLGGCTVACCLLPRSSIQVSLHKSLQEETVEMRAFSFVSNQCGGWGHPYIESATALSDNPS